MKYMTKRELHWMGVAARALWRVRGMKRALKAINQLPIGSTKAQWEDIRFEAVNRSFKALHKYGAE